MYRVKDSTIDYLLGREPTKPVPELMSKNITDKVVMVTGAGGSIGSELCRQIIQYKPKMLVLYELNEYALYSIHVELLDCGIPIATLIGSVKNDIRVENIIRKFGVQTVYHAAAYKHVPMVEFNMFEGILNNTIGTWQTAKAAERGGAETFVLISTDKAVRPTNIMGASKRLAEMVIQSMAGGKMKVSMVRFGNVLGSSGSVVPLFLEQIAQGKNLSVTHKDITRYFMSIPEAAQLVIQAGAMGGDGEVFVLDMGEPVKIYDMAVNMLRHEKGLCRFEAHDQIDITGLRPGEKLYEELLIGNDVSPTDHPRIMKAYEPLPYTQFQMTRYIQYIIQYSVNDDFKGMIQLLGELVSGFNHSGDIKDYLS